MKYVSIEPAVLIVIGLATGCHMAANPKQTVAEAKLAIMKAATENEEWVGKPVIQTIKPSKGEGDSLLGTYCGTVADSEDLDAKPRRFIYMALDKDVVFDTMINDLLPPSSDEERALIDDAVKSFDELWNDGCAEAMK